MKSSRLAVFTSLLSVAFGVPACAITVSSSTHPSLVSRDFTGEIGFAPYQREGGVASGARFEVVNGALKITNAHAGSFGIDTKTPAFDAEKFGHLFFDYLIPPTRQSSQTVKVNVFARVKGLYHGARFTGPSEVRPGSVFLGELAGVQADGKWHRAHIPLRDWLRALYPREEQLQVEEIIIGNWDNSNYLMAGIGGNGAGATWQIDNFVITHIGPGEAKFEVKADDGKPLANPAEYSWSLDGGEAVALKTPQITVSAKEGFHLLRVFDKAKKPIAEYGFLVAGEAPRVGTPVVQNGSLHIPVASSAGLDVKALKLTIGTRTFETDSPYLRWDGAAGVLQLDAAAAGLVWKDGEEIPLALDGVRDRLNRAMPAWKSTLAMKYTAQKTTPAPPLLVALKSAGVGTFEEGLDEWSPREGEGGAIVERDGDTRAAGKYSVRLTSPTNAATMGAWVRRTAFDAVKYPVIEFDYKIPPDVRVDFHLRVDGQMYSIGFTDRTPQFTRIGQIPDVKADEQWHHARIDLLNWLRKARPSAGAHKIEWIAIADAGYLGNGRGAQLWIDNFQFMPVVEGTPFESRVQVADVTGIKALSWVLDDKAVTIPPPAAKESGDLLKVAGDGRRWLHLRVQNGAGQWSDTAHLPLALDVSAPALGVADPAPGSQSGQPRLAIKVTDDTGLDTTDLSLTLADRQYTLRNDAFTYNDASGLLTLDLQKAVQLSQLTPLADGAQVSWKLSELRDAAGRSTPAASGAWTYQLASDKTLPSLEVDAPLRSASWRHTFESGVGDVDISSAKVEIVDRPELMGGIPNKALRLLPEATGRPLVVQLSTRGTNINTHNLLGFHYKIPPKARVALRLRVGRDEHLVKMIGDVSKPVATLAGIVGDDTWRWAQFDLKSIADKIKGNTISSIELVSLAASDKESAVEIDNVLLQPSGSGPVKLMWKGSDLSGIEKYRVAWDQNPGTAPTEETTEASRTFEPKSGVWWAHIQAADKAGNWSAVTHMPVIIP